MKPSKIRNDELKGLSEYRLNKMCLNGEIAKCPKCHSYFIHEKRMLLYNVALCPICQKKEDELQQTIKIMESWGEENE